MPLAKKDKQEIAQMIADALQGGGNENENENENEGVGDIVVLKGDVAKDFLAAMGNGNSSGNENENEDDNDNKNQWSGFGKKYFGN